MLNRNYPIKEYQFPLAKYIEAKSPESYSQDLLKNVAMLSFYPEGVPKELATIFGSFLYSIQKYPGDVDLLQTFNGCCSEDEVVYQFIKQLKRIVRKVVEAKEHYMSEFKAGLDHDYDFDLGTILNGKWTPGVGLRNRIIQLWEVDRFDDEELTTMLYIFYKKMFDGDGYDIVYNIFRNRRILRWSAKEILDGVKITNGKKFILENAIREKTYVKIDVVCIYDHRFIEMTNIIDIAYRENEDSDVYFPINEPAHSNDKDVGIELSGEIEKLYYSDYYYSPFKASKRMFALSRMNKDGEILNLIIPLISGNISLLYQMKSELDVLLTIYERALTIPIRTIKKQIDQMKNRISTVLEVPNDVKDDWYHKINMIVNEDLTREEQEEIIEYINKEMKIVINYYTIEYLDQIKLNPIPEYFNILGKTDYSTRLLPEKKSYAFIKRKPTDNPDIKKLIPENLKVSDFIKDYIKDVYEDSFDEDLPAEDIEEDSFDDIELPQGEDEGSEEESYDSLDEVSLPQGEDEGSEEESYDSLDEVSLPEGEDEGSQDLEYDSQSDDSGEGSEEPIEESVESEEGENKYCGAKPVPKGKVRGSPRYCAQANQVRYYGLVKIDEKLLNAGKGKGSEVNQKSKAYAKARDEIGILVNDIKKIKLIISEKDKKKKKHKAETKQLDTLEAKKAPAIKKFKAAEKALKLAMKNDEEQQKRSKKSKK